MSEKYYEKWTDLPKTPLPTKQRVASNGWPWIEEFPIPANELGWKVGNEVVSIAGCDAGRICKIIEIDSVGFMKLETGNERYPTCFGKTSNYALLPSSSDQEDER